MRGLDYVKGADTPTCHGQNKEIIRDDETERGQSRVHFFKGLLNLLLFERSLSGAGKQLGLVNDHSYQMLMLADPASHAPAAGICL